LYALLFADKEEELRAKGCNIKQPLDTPDAGKLRFESYRNTILDRISRAPRIKQTRLGTDGNNGIHMFQLTKSTLNPCDSKNYALAPTGPASHSIDTLPFGYRGVLRQ